MATQSRYQYGTSPRKTNPNYDKSSKKTTKKRELRIVENVPKKQAKVSSNQKKKQAQVTLTVVGIVLLLLTISCRNSQIDKKFNQIQEQKKNLIALQKENEQLKVNIENSLSITNIEKVAKEELGMQKLTNKQIVYINLPKKDYVQSASEKVIIEDEEKSWIEKIVDKIFNF